MFKTEIVFLTHDFSLKNVCVMVCVTWCMTNITFYLLSDIYYTHFNPYNFAYKTQTTELITN